MAVSFKELETFRGADMVCQVARVVNGARGYSVHLLMYSMAASAAVAPCPEAMTIC